MPLLKTDVVEMQTCGCCESPVTEFTVVNLLERIKKCRSKCMTPINYLVRGIYYDMHYFMMMIITSLERLYNFGKIKKNHFVQEMQNMNAQYIL